MKRLTLADVTLPLDAESAHLVRVGARSRCLTLVRIAGCTATREPVCVCSCECGEKDIVLGLRSFENPKRRPTCCERATHRAEFRVWSGMLQRCHNPRSRAFHYYGGRGITVDEAWRADFWQFLRDMGPRPSGTTLDRIDNEGGYSASNCRWVTAKVQANNMRTTVMVEWNGRSVPIAQIAAELGLDRSTLAARYRHCKDIHLAIERESGTRSKKANADPPKARRGVHIEDVVDPVGSTYPDMTGETWGRLTVVRMVGRVRYRSVVCECDCSCGTKGVLLLAPNIRTHHTTSCGCAAMESKKARATTHGKTAGKSAKAPIAPEYAAWQSMIQRCYNRKDPRYRSYGARGIHVSEAWRSNFEQFFADMGIRPGPGWSVDRIAVDGPYSAENCRWADAKTQANNRTTNIYVEHDGERVALTPLCERLGLDPKRVSTRLRSGMPLMMALKKGDLRTREPLPTS